MQRITISFTTEEAWLENRTKDLTSSDIGTLFGVGYLTYDELLKSKLSKISHIIEEDERMKWGKALESSIAFEFARQNSWQIRRKTEYMRIPEVRIGSSFDYEIEGPFQMDKYKGLSTLNELLEIKNVDSLQYKKEWRQGFEIEAPPKIELQIQNELLVSGLRVGYIGVLIGGNRGICLRREANKKVHDEILKRAQKFWKEVGI